MVPTVAARRAVALTPAASSSAPAFVFRIAADAHRTKLGLGVICAADKGGTFEIHVSHRLDLEQQVSHSRIGMRTPRSRATSIARS